MATNSISGQKARLRSRLSTSTGAFNDLGELRDYTLSAEMSEIDATSHQSSGWREIIPGMRAWSWTADSLYVDDDTGQDQLRDALSGDSKLTVQFRPDPTNVTIPATTAAAQVDGELTWEGDTFVTNWDLGGDNDDAAITTLSGVGVGELSTASSLSS